MIGKEGGEERVGAPPEEEEGTEDESSGETVIEAVKAVGAELEHGFVSSGSSGKRDLRVEVLGSAPDVRFSSRSRLDRCTTACSCLRNIEFVAAL